MKEALSSSLILGHFREGAPTEMHADARGRSLDAVPIHCVAGKEENYSVTEKEFLAVI